MQDGGRRGHVGINQLTISVGSTLMPTIRSRTSAPAMMRTFSCQGPGLRTAHSTTCAAVQRTNAVRRRRSNRMHIEQSVGTAP